MEEIRSVDRILTAKHELFTPKMTIQRALPSPVKRRIDPFLLVDHLGPKVLEPNESIYIPPHPHRGFEPVTLLLEGKLEHRDADGHVEILYPGDVHWITAGSGIVHAERLMEYEPGFGGTFQSVQIWINLPARMKMRQSTIQNIKAYNIPVINEDDGNIIIRLIAGDLYGQAGPAQTNTPLLIAHVRMQAGARTILPVNIHFNAFYYVLKGSVRTDENEVGKEHSIVLMKNNGAGIEIEAIEYSEMIVLGGQPINEPVASYGPFVMNKFPELQQAIHDYEEGLMGEMKL